MKFIERKLRKIVQDNTPNETVLTYLKEMILTPNTPAASRLRKELIVAVESGEVKKVKAVGSAKAKETESVKE